MLPDLCRRGVLAMPELAFSSMSCCCLSEDAIRHLQGTQMRLWQTKPDTAKYEVLLQRLFCDECESER